MVEEEPIPIDQLVHQEEARLGRIDREPKRNVNRILAMTAGV